MMSVTLLPYCESYKRTFNWGLDVVDVGSGHLSRDGRFSIIGGPRAESR